MNGILFNEALFITEKDSFSSCLQSVKPYRWCPIDTKTNKIIYT